MTSFLDVARYVSQFYGPLFREWKLRTKCFWLLRVLAFNGLHCSMPRPSSHIQESIVDSRLQRLVQHAANIYHRWQSSNGTFRWAPRQFTQWKVFAICVCVCGWSRPLSHSPQPSSPGKVSNLLSLGFPFSFIV